jgi:hypothetical protein
MQAGWARWLAAVILPGLLAFGLALLALAQPWQARLDVGSRFDRGFLDDFHRAEYNSQQQIGFRWSQPDARLFLPGAGQQTRLTLRVHGDYDGMPLGIGTEQGATALALRPGWQQITLLPHPAPLSGNIEVRLVADAPPNADDPRARGVALDWIHIASSGGAPPWGQAALVGLCAALTATLTGWAARGKVGAGALAGTLLALALAALLAFDGGSARLLLTGYTGRLALVLASSALVAAGAHWVLGWLNRRGVVALGPGTRHALAVVALLAFVLRFGGMAYPLNYNSDLPLILGRTWMVREGQLPALFLPNPALTPVQWGEDFTIPRSPFYYILTVPLTFLPAEGTGDKLGMMAFSSTIDALAVVLVGLLARLAGGSGRAAVMGAFLAAVFPVGLMFIVSWGILPTLLGQCLALLTLLLWLHLRPRLHKRRPWLLWTGLLTITFLSYPTALLFLGTTGALLLALLALRRDPATLPTLWAGVAALLLALLLFYGWHIPALFSETIPALLGSTAEGETAGFSLRRTLEALWVQPADKYGWLVLALAGGGALLLAATRAPNEQARYARLVLLAWGLAFVPLALADAYIVTFILKHLLHILPLLALLGGLLLGGLTRRRAAGRVVALVVLALMLWQGLVLEVDMIINAFAQLK